MNGANPYFYKEVSRMCKIKMKTDGKRNRIRCNKRIKIMCSENYFINYVSVTFYQSHFFSTVRIIKTNN